MLIEVFNKYLYTVLMGSLVKKKNAFSLIEVLVFVSILSIFIIAAITATTASLRNMKVNEHKILATKYSQELVEWLRSEKEENWETFVSTYTTTSPGKTYCFNDADISWPAEGECATDGLSPAIYKRQATLTSYAVPVARVGVNVIVSWTELGIGHTVPVNTVFTVFE